MLGSTAAWGKCVGPHLSPVAHLGMARAHGKVEEACLPHAGAQLCSPSTRTAEPMQE